ncbi:helix-turn-helix domain-containing protein [Vogesella indigofera]|uniref:Helix-turn-helix transcriptional regulator n=1 Tax=Vogesella indigofera TaxID=45465 RepID=A0ABT5I0X8_VOGIN|nr:helix-turn-helix transcriptional regulator [Vogesella indigofera]MDC7689825.1 helix-turn-helix transcriptional regulator [Vogesella indigofera]
MTTDHSEALNPRAIRRALAMGQMEFWTGIGVTQSSGSRYESGYAMPKPTCELLRLVYVEGINFSQLTKVDFEIAQYIKQKHPDLYHTLQSELKSKSATPP